VDRGYFHLLLITGVASLALFFDLGGPRLWDRDEPRNAACAREMLERGDWVVPTFNAELRVLKPVMKYWLMISAYKVFGVNEFAARFWSAVFALATVWATYFIGRRLFDVWAGFWSALVLASCLLFVAAGHLAKIDTALAFFAAMAILIFVYATFAPTEGRAPAGDSAFATPFPRSWGVAALLYATVGLGALAKGLPGLFLPPAVIGMFSLIVLLPPPPEGRERRWWHRLTRLLSPFAPGHFLRTFWRMRPITALVVSLAVASPWYILVGLRTDGEFLRGFFLEHHLGRAMRPMDDHSGPFLLYYFGAIATGFFPWSVFCPAVTVWLVGQFRKGHPWSPGYVLACCWIGVYVVIFSCAKTKLASYITPCFPALALLMGGFLRQLSANVAVTSRFWTRLALVLLGVVGLGMAVGLAVAARIHLPGGEWLGLIGVVLLVGAVAAFVQLERGRGLAACITLSATASVFVAMTFGLCLTRLGRNESQRAVFHVIHGRGNDSRLAFFGPIEPSWVFYAGHPIPPLSLAAPSPDESYRWKVKPIPVGEFFGQSGDPLIITTAEEWVWLRTVLPADAQVIADFPRFLRKGRYLLIGHAPISPTRPEHRMTRGMQGSVPSPSISP
jgi:4-amino-4-deoxy-L-arabinose transferase-like glycosyltransferase